MSGTKRGEPMSGSERGAFLDGLDNAGLAAFTLKVQHAVDGLRVGMHRSRHRGHSAVFLDHREYRPGDDPRLLDWRAFARTDRPSIKRFEQESEARVTLVLDRTATMNWSGFETKGEDDQKERLSKLDVAKRILGALAWVFLDQGDRVGCAAIDDALATLTPTEGGRAHRDRILEALYLASPGKAADLRQLRGLVDGSRRRQVIAIASDLLEPDLDNGERLTGSLNALRGRGHEVIMLHVLHDDEITLPDLGAARFAGLQGEPEVEAKVSDVREEYTAEMERFLARCRDVCVSAGARYVLAKTSTPISETLASVASRAHGEKR